MAVDRQAADQPADADEVIRIVVVDDDELVRSGLAAILDLEPDIEVVGQGADGVDVPALVARSGPDLVLMDVRMPRVDGIAATARLTERPDGPAVVVITTFESDDAVHDALLAGARGFVLKRARPEELLAAIRTVARTDSLVFPDAIRRVAARRRTATRPAWVQRITARERDVLTHVARGQTNAEVAESLVVSVETVKSHLRSLLAKSGSRHRTELVVRCYEAGVLGEGP
jgi:DNA-binding NarL/FixJ family response regulator